MRLFVRLKETLFGFYAFVCEDTHKHFLFAVKIS